MRTAGLWSSSMVTQQGFEASKATEQLWGQVAPEGPGPSPDSRVRSEWSASLCSGERSAGLQLSQGDTILVESALSKPGRSWLIWTEVRSPGPGSLTCPYLRKWGLWTLAVRLAQKPLSWLVKIEPSDRSELCCSTWVGKVSVLLVGVGLQELLYKGCLIRQNQQAAEFRGRQSSPEAGFWVKCNLHARQLGFCFFIWDTRSPS